MNNMTYVWIGLAIISWIYKLVKKGNKKNMETSSTPKEERKYRSPELNIEDLLKEIKQTETYSRPVEKKVIKPEVVAIDEQQYVKKINTSSKKNTTHSHAHSVENEEEFERFSAFEIDNSQDNKSLELQEKLSTAEGAREAFIMSEVFSKKY